MQYASEALKADREIVQAAVQQDGCALYYASVTLLENAAGEGGGDER